jgi:hypothetical protein
MLSLERPEGQSGDILMVFQREILGTWGHIGILKTKAGEGLGAQCPSDIPDKENIVGGF